MKIYIIVIETGSPFNFFNKYNLWVNITKKN